jgi:ribosome maturation factor RimP
MCHGYDNHTKEVEMASPEAIRDLLEPALASAGVELWDVEVSSQSVKVSVDRPGGIDLDSLASLANRVVSPILDDHPDLTPHGRFALEVSSPGLERSLRTVEQYRRYIGTEVSIKTTEPVAGARRHKGELLDVDVARVRIQPHDQAVSGGGGEGIELRFDQIERARTVFEWGSPDDRGPGRTAARNSAGHDPSAPGTDTGTRSASRRDKDTRS